MKRSLTILTSLLGTHLFFLMNLQFTAWPEMLSFPYLLNNGFSLYRDMVHPYPPLLTIILSKVYEVFGTNVIVLQYTTWFLILVSDLLVFAIVRLLTKSSVKGLFALSLYVFLQPFLEGNMLWFDFATVPFFLAGLYSMLFARENNYKIAYQLLLAGLFLMLSALVKQTAAIYLIISGLYLISQTRKIKPFLYFSFAPLFIGSVFLLKLIQKDSLSHFLNWTLIYPMKYWTEFPDYVQMALSRRELAIIFALLFPLAMMLFFRKEFFKDKNLVFLSLILVGSLLAVYPRFSFFHFQPALAMIVVISGYVIPKKVNMLFVSTILVSSVSLFVIIIYSTLRTQWRQEARFAGQNDFRRGQQMKHKVSEEETVYLLGPHSALYVFSERLPPKPWVDNFGWYFEVPNLQESVIDKWSIGPPDYVVWTEPEIGDWYELGTYQPEDVTNWIEENYTRGEELEEDIWLWKKNKDKL